MKFEESNIFLRNFAHAIPTMNGLMRVFNLAKNPSIFLESLSKLSIHPVAFDQNDKFYEKTFYEYISKDMQNKCPKYEVYRKYRFR